jgi:DNA-binding CsgD family transcriptional regulator
MEVARLRPVRNDLVRLKPGVNRASGLPDADLRIWTRVLRELPQGRGTEADVLRWMEGPLREFFPFKRFIGCYGNLSGGRINMLGFLSSGYDPAFLASLDSSFDLKARGCFEWWVANREAFIVDVTGTIDEPNAVRFATRRSLDEIERFSLGIVAAHGVIDPFVNAGTYFSFSGVPGTQPQRTLAALDLIVPVLHALYLQTRQAERSAVDLMVLTARQRDLVDLALMGLSDKAIASRLAISENTVGNHFRTIFAKLGITKRSQLVALLK